MIQYCFLTTTGESLTDLLCTFNFSYSMLCVIHDVYIYKHVQFPLDSAKYSS